MVSMHLKPMLDDKGKALLTLKQGNELKAAIRGHYLSNAMDALTTNAQFGKFYSAEKFINQLGKKPQLRKFLFQGDDAKKLKDLQNTLAFAQGDLSRLPGLPGGIFIQLKQAGAPGQILQLGQAGTIGVAGVLGGLVPACRYFICS